MADMTTAVVYGYHPSGFKVTIPLYAENGDYAAIFAAVDKVLAAGFTVDAPGVEAGEKKEEIGFVVRKEHFRDDGTKTPTLDLYVNHDAMQFSFITVYLNTPEDVAAFEAASGMKLDSLPVYMGNDKLERKTPKSAQFVRPAARPFSITWIPNPKYNESEYLAAKAANKMYSVPRKKFVKFLGASAGKAPASGGHLPAPPPSANGTPPAVHPIGDVIADMQDSLDNNDQDAFNRICEYVKGNWATYTPDQQRTLAAKKKAVTEGFANNNAAIPF